MIDGCYQRDATLEYNANCVPGDTGSDSRLYLGHALPTHQFETCPTTWQMGNLMLFKGTGITFLCNKEKCCYQCNFVAVIHVANHSGYHTLVCYPCSLFISP